MVDQLQWEDPQSRVSDTTKQAIKHNLKRDNNYLNSILIGYLDHKLSTEGYI